MPCEQLAPSFSEADYDELWQLRYRTGVNCGRCVEPDPALTEDDYARWEELERRYHELLEAGRWVEAFEILPLLTRERIEELERNFADPSFSPTKQDVRDWRAAVEVFNAMAPTSQELVWNEGEPKPEGWDEPDAFDEWHAQPIADGLFPRPTHASRSRKPTRTLARMRPTPRGPRARRIRRRAVRKAGARARDGDREPEPPLTVVPLARFRRDVSAWLGGVA